MLSRHSNLARTHDRLFSPRNRFRTRPLHRRPGRRQARGRPSRCATAGGGCSSTGKLREEVLPKNILMIGPTGVGKTEIARRLAKLAGAPFIKVEATKFTEVGYVGRDVEQIVRDLVEVAIAQIARAQAQGRAGPRAAGRRGARARCAGRAGVEPRDPRFLPQEAARRRTQRQGNRDRDAVVRRHADVRNPRHARRADGRDLDRRYLRQDGRRAPRPAA